jgi:uncharacterized protein (TIGR00661 family)
MKIFYAVQATGNGHISRARQLLPYLRQYGHVDVFLSGANATLDAGELPVKYRSRGMSLYYSRCGGLSYRQMWQQNSLVRALAEARHLPVESYDVVINDFEFITAQACRIKGVPSVQFGHQASFMSAHTPRPAVRSMIGEMILRKYAPASRYVGLHFQRYESFIHPPVIKDYFLRNTPVKQDHIAVYLPAYNRSCCEKHFRSLAPMRFHWFLPHISKPSTEGNITLMPVSNQLFNESLLTCSGLITGGGFETPAEALFLGKRLMSIPIRAQYEQQCNAAALAQIGVAVHESADMPHFDQLVSNWLTAPQPAINQEASSIPELLNTVFNLAHSNTQVA